MKIGILTFHRVVNDGSVLQAYCLFSVLCQKFPKAQIEIIDYCPFTLHKRNLRAKVTRRVPFLNLSEIRKSSFQKRFLRTHIVTSAERLSSDSLYDSVQFLNRQQYDVIFVGSDTVWDTRINGGGPQPPNIYFLPDVECGVKVSLAASMDKGDPSFLPANRWRDCVNAIRDFDLITIRDNTTMEFLGDQGVDESSMSFMPDPTFLHDFTSIAVVPKLNKGNKPLAGVALSSPDHRRHATRILRGKGYSVLNLLGASEDLDEVRYKPKSFGERVGVFGELDLLIGDRFHSSICALQLGCAKVILVEPVKHYSRPFSGKGYDLFKRLGIEQMVLRVDAGNELDVLLSDELFKIADQIRWPITGRIGRLSGQGAEAMDTLCLRINSLL